MGLLDGIEKLITEHGSAAVLKERIALAEDKYAALQRELTTCDAARTQLQTENQRLELDNYKLKDKLSNLEKQLEDRHGSRLNDVEEKILVAVCDGGNMTAEQLARVVGENQEVTKFHLNELHDSGLVVNSLSAMAPTKWSISQEGRRYLISHGLLK